MLLVSAFPFHLSFSPYIFVIHTSAMPNLFYPTLSVQEWSCPGNPSASWRVFHWTHVILAPVILQQLRSEIHSANRRDYSCVYPCIPVFSEPALKAENPGSLHSHYSASPNISKHKSWKKSFKLNFIKAFRLPCGPPVSLLRFNYSPLTFLLYHMWFGRG